MKQTTSDEILRENERLRRELAAALAQTQERGPAAAGLDVTALQESEARLRHAQQIAGVGTWEWDIPTGARSWSEQTYRQFGLEPALTAPANDTLLQHVHPEDRQAFTQAIERAVAGAAPYDLEFRAVHPDGAVRVLHTRGEVVTDADGRPTRMFGVSFDVTDSKRREQELREAERRARLEAARLQAVLDAAPTMIWTALDRECRLITGNRAAYEFARVPRGEDLSKTGPDPERLLHHRLFRDGRELAPEEMPLQVVARMGRPLLQDAVECVFDDGSVRSVAGNVEPILDAEGNPTGAVAAYLDVTERKRAEEALCASEERFRAAQEVSLDAFTILSAVRDDGGRVVDFRWEFANPQAERILGRGELKGRRLLEIVPGNKASSDLFDRYVRVVETGEPHDYEVWYESEGIRGWFRNMTVKIGDGIAISFSDITKRKQSERALAEANERLLEAGKRKDEFLAMLAHELRNPLAAIVSSAYILETGELQGRLGRAAGVVRRQAGHMARLLDDLLDVSRVTHGKITLHRERVLLMPAIESAVEAAWPQIESARHRLSVVGLGPKIEVDGDPVRLAQMVGNLLSNAVKYTPPPGDIQLTVEPDGDEVAIRVRDNGIGISPAVLPSVFDLFVQGDNSPARTRGGLGIGLTMVRVLAEMHGGRVEAHSEGTGKGSEFVIWLPLAQMTRQEQAGPEAAAPFSRRVLVVDDVADSAEMVALALEMEGHQVAAATSGAQALKVAAEFQPDVILLDLGMPLMDGWEVARRLRQDPQFERVVIVALTGYGQDEDRQRTAEAGFDHHLAKPISIDAISQLLRACLPAGG